MHIVSLFCEIDDFFWRLKTIRHDTNSPERPLKNGDAPGPYIPAR